MVEIEQVTNEAALRQFIDLPWRIYREYPNWVPPLKREVRDLLDFSRHPFWLHARGAIFVARRDGQVVGRITAQVDDNYNKLWTEKLGSFGFFECENDPQTAAALLDAAADWVRKEGMTVLRGPLSPSSNDEIGLLIEGFEYPPAFLMTYTAPYYPALLEAWGLAKAKDLIAFHLDGRQGVPEALGRITEGLRANPRIKVRHLDRSRMESEVRLIKELYNDSWQKNWGFSPLTDKELDHLAANLQRIAIPELVLFAYYDDEPAGLSITLPDFNQVLRHLNGKVGLLGLLKYLWYRRKINSARSIVFGFRPKYRRLGLPALLFYHTYHNGYSRGLLECELGWNLEDNQLINDFDRRLGARQYKRYRVYEKQLTT